VSRRGRLPPLLCALASLALRYPGPDVVARREEAGELAADLPRGEARDALRRFVAWWRDVPPPRLEAAYVETFDLHRRASLYLSWYRYGDRRQRGQAFVRLKHLVEGRGYRFAGRELPDYLPLLLEFAALEPEAGAEVLAEHRVGLELLRAALADASSPWADVVAALCLELPPLDEAGLAAVHRLAAEGPPGETVGLEPFAPPEVMPEPAWEAPPR
jgi:nitrate reductase delta subunit